MFEKKGKEQKCYIITCECSSTVELTVWAEDVKEAKMLALDNQYSEKDIKGFEVENILKVEEEEC